MFSQFYVGAGCFALSFQRKQHRDRNETALSLLLAGVSKLPAMFWAVFLQRACGSPCKHGLSGVHRAATGALACHLSPVRYRNLC